MAQDYFMLLTLLGRAKVAQAIADGTDINLSEVAVGDGDYTPSEGQTGLVSEQYRTDVTEVTRDTPDNPDYVIVQMVIPPESGGWTVREVGIFDGDGDLFAIGKYPPAYKPTFDQGSGMEMLIEAILEVTSQADVTITIDPSIVLASRDYVDGQITDAMSVHESKTAAHEAADISYDNASSGMAATDAQGAIDEVKAGADGGLATHLSANPAHQAEHIEYDNTVSGLAATDTQAAADECAALIDATSVNLVPTGTVLWFAAETSPAGFLKANGAAVSRTTYANLYGAIGETFGAGDGSTTFNLPDLRGEFVRGWDDGAGVDPDAATRTDRGDGTTGDHVGTRQGYAMEDHWHPILESGRFPGANPTPYSHETSTSNASISSSSTSSNTTCNATGKTSEASTPVDTSTETRPRNVALLACIKLLEEENHARQDRLSDR